MSFAENVLNYWQFFIVAPMAFVSAKIFSLNAKVSVHDSKIKSIEESLSNLCSKTDETNKLLQNIDGQLKEHFRNN